jgi:tetratricopeptide (TPR) repeat protein
MALMLQGDGDMEHAMQHVAAAQRMHPDYAALGNLGVFYQRAEMWDEAIDAMRRAQREQPESPKLANQLAQLLIVREGLNPDSVQTAISLAEQAVRSTGETNAKYLRTLAVAYAAGGRLADALRTAELGRACAGDDPDLVQWFTLKATQYREAMAPHKN